MISNVSFSIPLTFNSMANVKSLFKNSFAKSSKSVIRSPLYLSSNQLPKSSSSNSLYV